LFVDPKPDEALLAGMYALELDAGPDELLGELPVRRARHRARTLAGLGARRILEVGCGAGEFLDALREQGLEAEGVEPGRPAPAAGRPRARGDELLRPGDGAARPRLPQVRRGGILLGARGGARLRPAGLGSRTRHGSRGAGHGVRGLLPGATVTEPREGMDL